MAAFKDVVVGTLEVKDDLKMKLSLPKRENLFKTTWEDSLDLYYMPLVRNVYLQRFKMAAALLDNKKYTAILDLGFGCGIFLKELSLHTDSLCGVDIHENIEKVQRMAEKESFLAQLKKGSIFSLPFLDAEFDCIVCMSILEHLRELDLALAEVNRIARQGADIIFGFPIKNAITDSFFMALGYSAREIHPSDHEKILKAIPRHFRIAKVIKYPRLFPTSLGLYCVVKSQKC